MFEESGILLAKNKSTGQLVKLSPTEREEGRHAIHRNEITFDQWLKRVDADSEADTGKLLAHGIPSKRMLGMLTKGSRNADSLLTLDNTRYKCSPFHNTNVHLFSTPCK